jgi:hypothetical protein
VLCSELNPSPSNLASIDQGARIESIDQDTCIESGDCGNMKDIQQIRTDIRLTRHRHVTRVAGRILSVQCPDVFELCAQASKQGKYVATSCPICLTDFADSEAEAVPAGAVATSTAVDSPRLADGGAATEADALLGQASTSAEQGGSLRRRVRSRDLEGAASRGGKPPFLLPCGHSFCEPCIMRWLDGHAECPSALLQAVISREQ